MPGQAQQFNPESHQDPARVLTLAIRGLHLGDRILLSNGTVVKSIAIRHGAHMARRFAVTSKGSGPGDRHKALVLGKSSFRTASEAAMSALGKIGERA